MKHTYNIENTEKVYKFAPCGGNVVIFDVFNTFFL